MIRTIRGKFMVAFVGLVLFIFIMFWLSMQFFIESYYYKQKVNSMQNMVSQINTVLSVGKNPLEKLEDLQYLGYNFEGKIAYYETDPLAEDNEYYILKHVGGYIQRTIDLDDGTAYILDTDVPVKDTKWLSYVSPLVSGDVAIMLIPVAAMDQTIEVMSFFLITIGGVVLLVAIAIAGVVSTNMTRPIKKLTIMADSLRQLNFEVTYKEDRQDELGELGQTFNALAAQLDASIKSLQYELSKEKELDSLRKQFIAQVSHELQTPLSVIHGYIEALEDGVVDSEEELHDYYRIIVEESGKMSKMIKELLQISEMDSGAFKANKHPLELGNFFDQMNKAYQTLLLHGETKLDYRPLKKEVWMMADQLKLEQAFRNILNNAMKYANPGSVIRFTTDIEDQVVTVMVENDGPKIPEEELAKIFESFYKGTTSVMKEGTGIGLAVTAKVLKVHGATYYAKNHDNGVTMVVKLIVDDKISL